MSSPITNIVVAGLGGQGVLTATDLLGEALLRAGHDVKKSEVHGMAQRGGSVQSDVRFGPRVHSPMVPAGQADFLVALAGDQIEVTRHLLRPGGLIIAPELIPLDALPHRRTLNVALIGALSHHLDVAEAHWLAALHDGFRAELWGVNEQAFQLGRAAAGNPFRPALRL